VVRRSNLPEYGFPVRLMENMNGKSRIIIVSPIAVLVLARVATVKDCWLRYPLECLIVVLSFCVSIRLCQSCEVDSLSGLSILGRPESVGSGWYSRRPKLELSSLTICLIVSSLLTFVADII
jgi:hypothetical protein